MSDFRNETGDVANLTQVGHVESLTINQYAAPSARARVVLLPPFKPSLYPIVGRAGLMDEICAALRGGQRILALVHLPGVGKTTLAAQLAKHAELAALFPDGILWAHLGLTPDLRGQLRKWAAALGVPEPRMKDFETLDHWREAVSSAIGGRRLLLVIDDAWESEAAECFMLGDEACGYLITTRYPGVGASIAQELYEVRKLETDDGLTLLASLAPDAVKAEPEDARQLVAAVDGLPLALVLMGHYLRQQSHTRQRGRIRAALEALHDVEMRYALTQPAEYPSDTPRSLANVIESSYLALGREPSDAPDAIDGEQQREAIQRLAVLRPDPARFTRALAAHLTELPGGALHELCDAGLVEVLQIKPRPDDPSGGERFTIHRTIGEYLRQKLGADQARALHLRVAEYYREQLRERDEQYQSSTSDYRRWYRYEDIDWQDCKDNWLFHMQRAGEYEAVAFAFLIAWFDAFWWWGCFLEFGFCDQLLREWRQRAIRPESELGLRQLADFKDAYPKETENRRGGDWQKVAEVLESVRRRTRLDSEPGTLLEPAQRHLRGLTSIFLAEAARFGRDDPATAETFYRDALAQFRHNEDRWDEAWTLYHLADCLAENGSHGKADELCAEAIELARQEEDPEVQALIACVQADAALTRGDDAAAASHLHAAVCQAYRFQVDPQDPDPYTIRFYPLIAHRVAARLVRLHQQDAPRAASIAQVLHGAWHPGIGTPDGLAAALRDADALAALLFAPTLAAGQLDDEAFVAAYAGEVRAVVPGLLDVWA
ncbi:NB-ARC domain-containing protein [Niveibacterium sp. SC-1]|uniref:NB-ARC domain-containing protein n=1 Tax=Niveibacterium sp. SC-1 TaxID=3135646 RepID=UPI00311D5E92